ncbi:hypothetical protein HAX54_033940, partial [Datura stramonium]|nr:hypothetical protein [Datura stramonium]
MLVRANIGFRSLPRPHVTLVVRGSRLAIHKSITGGIFATPILFLSPTVPWRFEDNLLRFVGVSLVLP